MRLQAEAWKRRDGRKEGGAVDGEHEKGGANGGGRRGGVKEILRGKNLIVFWLFNNTDRLLLNASSRIFVERYSRI